MEFNKHFGTTPPVAEPERELNSDIKTWSSGAKRSTPKPDWWMLPLSALREVLRRFEVGKKYGVHNWKIAQFSDDLDYVRQFDAHGQEHRREFFALVDKPKGAMNAKGDNLIENLAAQVWNALALLDYALENEDLVRAAFSQYPEGHPKRLSWSEWKEPQSAGIGTKDVALLGSTKRAETGPIPDAQVIPCKHCPCVRYRPNKKDVEDYCCLCGRGWRCAHE